MYNEGQQFDLHSRLEMRDEGYQTFPDPSDDIYGASPPRRNTERGASVLQNSGGFGGGGDEDMDIDTPEHGNMALMGYAPPPPPPPVLPRTAHGNRIIAYEGIPSRTEDNARSAVVGEGSSSYAPQGPEVTSGIRSGLRSQPPQMESAVGNIGEAIRRSTRATTAGGTNNQLSGGMHETRKRKAPTDEGEDEDEEEEDDDDDAVYAGSEVIRHPWAGKTVGRPKNWGTKAKRQKRTEDRRRKPLTKRPMRQSAQELRDHYLGLHLRPAQRYDPRSGRARRGRDTLNPPSVDVQPAFPEFQEWRPGGAMPHLHKPGPKSRDPPDEEQDCGESIPAWNETGTPWPGETYICGKQPTKLCDHILDNTALACDPCHREQTEKTHQRRWNIIERSKARHCHTCAATGRARHSENTVRDRCFCIQQLTTSVIYDHRISLY